MAADGKRSPGICSLLMASLFALSACFQFNDPDWYFWVPLYSTACIVNLVDGAQGRKRRMAKFAFWLGLFLLIKVIMEDFLQGKAGFWSLNMRERIVREKLGSGLVLSSMFFNLESSSGLSMQTHVAKYGTPILVVIAYSLSFAFFVFQHDDMKY